MKEQEQVVGEKSGQRTKARRKKSWGDRDESGVFGVDAHQHAAREAKEA